MVIDRTTGEIRHARFRDVGSELRADDVLVLNNTRVIPARLVGTKEGTGARIEVFLLHPVADGAWEALVRPGKRVQKNTRVDFDGVLHARVIGRTASGTFRVSFDESVDFRTRLEQVGRVPLPPYIRREADDDDRVRYQNVYATHDGAVAAPTAGLHFTEDLLDALRSQGVTTVEATLHVGMGTFQPLKDDALDGNRLHAEFAELTAGAAKELAQAREAGRRIVAVGTTSVRTLESAASGGAIEPFRGLTELFIRPGYSFRAVDALITNFHLPKSSLLMLVAAFAGYDLMREAYRVAVEERYRFYSYGDAMIIV